MNFSKKAEPNFNIVPEGEYEVIITKAEEAVTKSGKQNISIVFTIRNDVEQVCKNRLLFLQMWKKKAPDDDDLQVDGYNYNQLKTLLDACRITDTDFETVADFCKALVGRCVIVSVYHEEYNGKKYAKIYGFGINYTCKPECRHVQKSEGGTAPRPAEAFASQSAELIPDDFEEILGDGDVPF